MNVANIARPRLWRQLDQLAAKKLALISAPAGFGKTLLLASWLDQNAASGRFVDKGSAARVAWLSLDEGDNDPARFTRYLLAAMQLAGQEKGQMAPPSQPPAPPPSLRKVISRLINGCSQQAGELLIILDDYHLLQNPTIHEGLAFWLANMPPKCHLIIATRADPPLPLAQIRLRQEMVELRAQQLRFDEEESREFLNEIMKLGLPPASLQLLARRTEGWPAGLQLAALALQGQSTQAKAQTVDRFNGSHVFVIDYFMEQVWLRMPPALQRFLLDTAILERLTASLCNALTGGRDGQAKLQELQRQNLFLTALDDERRWFRTHQLFAALLRSRLQQETEPDHIRDLHLRASIWFQEHALAAEAIAHALRSGDWDWAAQLVENEAAGAQARGDLKTLLDWLSALPDEAKRRRPRLLIAQGQALFLSGQIVQAEAVLQEARALLRDSPSGAESDELHGELATQMAIIAAQYEDPQRIITEARDALAYLPQDNLAYRARAGHMLGVGYGLQGDTQRLVEYCRQSSRLAEQAGHSFLQAHILQLLGSTLVHMGQLVEASRAYEQVISLGTSREQPAPYTGLGKIGLADVQLERFDLAAASVSLAEGIALCENGGIGYNLLGARCLAVRLAQAKGDKARAEQELAAAEAIVRANLRLPLVIAQYAACASRFWLDHGQVERAQWLLKEPIAGAGELNANQLPVVVSEYFLAAQGRLYLRLEQYEELDRIDQQVMATAEPAGRGARVLEFSLLRALANQQVGDRQAALQALQSALVIAAPAGYRLMFLEHGRRLRELLQEFQHWSGSAPDTRRYAAAILQDTAGQEALSPMIAHSEPSSFALVEPLSSREQEVLALICGGLSNKQISGQLCISLNTVKKHASHIYEKLQVNSRTQAIARAHELRLVE